MKLRIQHILIFRSDINIVLNFFLKFWNTIKFWINRKVWQKNMHSCACLKSIFALSGEKFNLIILYKISNVLFQVNLHLISAMFETQVFNSLSVFFSSVAYIHKYFFKRKLKIIKTSIFDYNVSRVPHFLARPPQ